MPYKEIKEELTEEELDLYLKAMDARAARFRMSVLTPIRHTVWQRQNVTKIQKLKTKQKALIAAILAKEQKDQKICEK